MTWSDMIRTLRKWKLPSTEWADKTASDFTVVIFCENASVFQTSIYNRKR